jgi:hypothetical protein
MGARVSTGVVGSIFHSFPANLCIFFCATCLQYDSETGRESARESTVGYTGRGDGVLESSRPTMSTARVQTALAALAAEKQMLMSKLALVDSELEQKRVKAVRKLFQN